MPNSEPVVSVSDLRVVYPGRRKASVEGVSFELEKGSITTLIGPNGSGKSTVIKAMLGLIESSGRVRIFGQQVKESYEKIGFLPQRFTFDGRFPVSVFEFVAMPLLICTDPHAAQKEMLRKVLKSVGCLGVGDWMLNELSGGQLQRVLLARALVHNPRLLILDEPEAGVDVGGEQSLYDLLEKLVKDKELTVLVASHELDVVYTYADHVICVNKNMVCNGKPKEVLNQEVFEKLYGRELKFYGHVHRESVKKEADE